MTAVLHNLLAMHAPDRLFSMPVNLAFAVAVVAVLAVALRRVARQNDPRAVPMMGIMAAFVFAAQMLNFPIAAGTTGHLLGGTLAAILLGPWAATVVMAAVIVVQALVFQDGGVTVLGPNIFNMGVIGTLAAYSTYRAAVHLTGRHPARLVGAAFFASWLAVVLAAGSVSVQLAVSGTVPLARAFPAMLYTHMLIGVGEGLITAAVVAFVLRARPDLVFDAGGSVRPVGGPALVAGLSIALVFGVGLSLLPSLWDHPDGLEYVLQEQGLASVEAAGPSVAPFPDYAVAGVDGLASTSLAGGIGTLLMFVLSFAVGRLLVRPTMLSGNVAARGQNRA